MYICYVNLGDSIVPIVCESIKQNEILKDHIILTGTKLIEDNVLPILDISEISISKKQLHYYVAGHIKKENENLFSALERSREKQKQKENKR